MIYVGFESRYCALNNIEYFIIPTIPLLRESIEKVYAGEFWRHLNFDIFCCRLEFQRKSACKTCQLPIKFVTHHTCLYDVGFGMYRFLLYFLPNKNKNSKEKNVFHSASWLHSAMIPMLKAYEISKSLEFNKIR